MLFRGKVSTREQENSKEIGKRVKIKRKLRLKGQNKFKFCKKLKYCVKGNYLRFARMGEAGAYLGFCRGGMHIFG
jgi:hypothetical protein